MLKVIIVRAVTGPEIPNLTKSTIYTLTPGAEAGRTLPDPKCGDLKTSLIPSQK